MNIDIEKLGSFLKGELGNDSQVASIGGSTRKHLEIKTTEDISQKTLVALVERFFAQEQISTEETILGLKLGNHEGIAVIAASEMSLDAQLPHSFITIHESKSTGGL